MTSPKFHAGLFERARVESSCEVFVELITKEPGEK